MDHPTIITQELKDQIRKKAIDNWALYSEERKQQIGNMYETTFKDADDFANTYSEYTLNTPAALETFVAIFVNPQHLIIER